MSLWKARVEKNRRLQHDMVLNVVKQSKTDLPWMTRDIINKSFQKHRINRRYDISMDQGQTSAIVSNANNADRKEVHQIIIGLTPTASSNQRKGGKPKDST